MAAEKNSFLEIPEFRTRCAHKNKTNKKTIQNIIRSKLGRLDRLP